MTRGVASRALDNDPHIPTLPAMRHDPEWRRSSRERTEQDLASRDGVRLVTDHSADDGSGIARPVSPIVATRNATRGVADPRATIVRA